MAETETPPQVPIHLEVRYEHSDANARRLIIIGAGILVGAWICVAVLYFYFSFLRQHRAATTPGPAIRAVGRALEPPEPRIQTDPTADYAAFEAAENAQLNTYRWVDRKAGMVTLPIERAIQLTAQQGIPPQKAPDSLKLYPPQAGTRRTGLEGKVQPEPQ